MISIITPTFNRPEYLKGLIDSFKGQEGDWEHLIIDDIKAHKGAEWVIDLNDRRVKYETGDWTHPGEAINHGFNMCGGDYMTFVCDDSLLTKGSIAKRVEIMSEGWDVLFSAGYNKWKGKPPVLIMPGNRDAIRNQYEAHSEGICFTREVLEKTGGLDENIKYADDQDFKTRLIAFNYTTDEFPVVTQIQHKGQRARSNLSAIKKEKKIIRAKLNRG